MKERPTFTIGQIELIVEAQDLGVPPLRSSVAVLVCFAGFLFFVRGGGAVLSFTYICVLSCAREKYLKQKHIHIDHILTPISDR